MGFLLGSISIHSKSCGEHTCSSAQLIVHQDAYSVPILGLMEWLSVSNFCRNVSSFVLLTCILYLRMILGIILGNSRDLTCRGTNTTCRCYCRLFRLFLLFRLFQFFQLFGSFSSFSSFGSFSSFSSFSFFWLFRLFQLFRGGDLVDAVLSFAFALAFSFLVLLLCGSLLLVFLNRQSLVVSTLFVSLNQ